MPGALSTKILCQDANPKLAIFKLHGTGLGEKQWGRGHMGRPLGYKRLLEPRSSPRSV